MAFQAKLVHGGDVRMVDYTPGSDVAAGDVVVVGDVPRIAHRKIASGDLGALAEYGGVYEVTGGAAIAAGTDVYWDNTENKVTETAASNTHFGRTVTACSGDDATCNVLHMPKGITGS